MSNPESLETTSSLEFRRDLDGRSGVRSRGEGRMIGVIAGSELDLCCLIANAESEKRVSSVPEISNVLRLTGTESLLKSYALLWRLSGFLSFLNFPRTVPLSFD